MRPGWRGLLAVVFTMLAQATADAGAWLQPHGRAQAIFSSTATVASRGFGRGAPAPGTERFLKAESTARLEYGLTDEMTLISGGELAATLKRSEEQTDLRQFAKGAFGARFAVARWNGGVLSVEAEGIAAAERRYTTPGRRHSAPIEARLSLLAGQGLPVAGRHAFFDLRAGFHKRSGGAGDSVEVDLTFGIELVPRVQFMLQGFNAFAVGHAPAGAGRWRRHKGQASVVLRLTDGWSMQFGAFMTLAGRETLRERGVLVASWRRF
jgi:hypothetical protein